MNGFFAIVTLLTAAGVVSGCERMEVKRGEKVVVENKSGMDVRLLTLYEASDCNNPEKEIYRYCSPEENKSGCTNKNCSTFFIDTNSVSFTPLNASDGCYVAQVIFNNSNEEKVLIVVNGHGQQSHTVSPDPPPQENPETNSTKGTETPGTDDRSTLGIAVGIALVLIAVGIAVCIFAWCCLKKKNESEASDRKKDPKRTSLIESNIKAGEQTTGDSFKMVDEDRISCSEDDNLKEVLTHGGDEDDDDNSKHNNTNNYCDRITSLLQNLLSNNTNNYVNNNDVANGKNYDDDDDGGISIRDNSRNDYL